MLFYAALALLGVLLGAVVVFAFRSLSRLGSDVTHSLSYSRRNSSVTGRHIRLNSRLASTPSPWGWGRSGKRVGTSHKRKSARSTRQETADRSTSPAGTEGHGSRVVDTTDSVLKGYDMARDRVTDTSSWPYRDTLTGDGNASGTERHQSTADRNRRPVKPWGW